MLMRRFWLFRDDRWRRRLVEPGIVLVPSVSISTTSEVSIKLKFEKDFFFFF